MTRVPGARGVIRAKQVIATVRELMHLGPNDPAPMPPPLPEQTKEGGRKRNDQVDCQCRR